MKAITLHQPWASLVAVGAKRYETRSWTTHHMGDLAIHAAKTREWAHLWANPAFSDPLKAILNIESFEELPFGAVVAIATLGKVWSTGYIKAQRELGTAELLRGDWSSGRWAWPLMNIMRVPEPVPARGRQRLWDWEPPEGFWFPGMALSLSPTERQLLMEGEWS